MMLTPAAVRKPPISPGPSADVLEPSDDERVHCHANPRMPYAQYLASRNAGSGKQGRASGLRASVSPDAARMNRWWTCLRQTPSSLVWCYHAHQAGVRISNVSAYHLYPDVGEDQLRRVVHATHALGAPIIVANVYLPGDSLIVERLGRYCEFAREAGVQLALEFVSFSTLRTCQQARRILAELRAPNMGLVIDPLHLARSGGTPDDVELGSCDHRHHSALRRPPEQGHTERR